MCDLDGQLTDYRSMDVIFGGGLLLNARSLSISTQSFANLIKTTDFLRLHAIQGLTQLKFLEVSFQSLTANDGETMKRAPLR